MKRILITGLFLCAILVANAQENVLEKNKWSKEKASEWYAKQKWITGANFVPSTAINQLEMWQSSTFDPETIDRELGYAESIGFNTMRVYLHSLAYKANPKDFKKNMETYLGIANKHGIKTMFVFFDDVWGKEPKIGKQPEPVTGTHNSGWVQDPGDPASKNKENFPALEIYVKDILNTFANDDRVLLWDLYNEPGNTDKLTGSMPLLKAIFTWAREVNPSQPLSAGLWRWDFQELNEFQAANSDILTYHHYDDEKKHQHVINLLKTHGRPMICTEYMARTNNSRFSNVLPVLKKENIGAINWGLVNGKSNTIYAWNTPIEDGAEPIEWFHDIFRKDGTPYRQDEVDLIKKLNGEEK
ncbi:cellulase family glycosylhydrolase [Muricauda sp. CAU 1633]|uniref:glycoside hydrolase family 2 TIM barrel-domain containing protein n=1 Tax=Allomuricauda sp. CAU 1633 TaxID=2816036 RepID=UPI001A8E6688|nr:glycoside hydrolase family 2 TIM barrel-domain containing protein [Muricauda sp. CAU 1633]MBO0324122.1 cellulase family glycosylhydrolase [Muricauda sp. CAU 1633]